jgi:protease-4
MSKSFGREAAGVVFKAFVVVLTIVLVVVSLTALYEIESVISDGTCNIAVLPLEGTILPYYGLVDVPLVVTPEMVETFLTDAEAERSIKAVLLEINSPGGTPVASQRIAERLKSSTLPVVGMIGDVGASGGYMVAAATEYLIASSMSDVGSIGVNMSYVEQSQQNEEEGLTYVQLTTGKFKDAGSPDRPITDEERELFQRDLDIVHNEFIDLVANYRNMDRDKVAALADGSTMSGSRALENGLVDEIGGRASARSVLATILELPEEDVVFCEYEATPLLF